MYAPYKIFWSSDKLIYRSIINHRPVDWLNRAFEWLWLICVISACWIVVMCVQPASVFVCDVLVFGERHRGRWRGITGEGRGVVHPKFLAVGKLSKKLLFWKFQSENFGPKMQNLGLKTSILGGNLGTELKFGASIISLIGNLRHCLLEFCWKFAMYVRKSNAHLLFLNPRRHWFNQCAYNGQQLLPPPRR